MLLLYYNPWFRARRFRNGVLLAASLLFYAWGEPVFVFVLVLSIIITWRPGFALITPNKTHKKVILYLGISFHVILLFCFKYLSFLSGQIALLFHQDTTGIQIAFPIGISFFTFQLKCVSVRYLLRPCKPAGESSGSGALYFLLSAVDCRPDCQI